MTPFSALELAGSVCKCASFLIVGFLVGGQPCFAESEPDFSVDPKLVQEVVTAIRNVNESVTDDELEEDVQYIFQRIKESANPASWKENYALGYAFYALALRSGKREHYESSTEAFAESAFDSRLFHPFFVLVILHNSDPYELITSEHLAALYCRMSYFEKEKIYRRLLLLNSCSNYEIE